jgi:hypothetical protein
MTVSLHPKCSTVNLTVSQFDLATYACQTVLVPERDEVLRIIRSHPYYQDQETSGRLKIEQECVKFFDQRFTFQVARLMNNAVLSKYYLKLPTKLLRLGGSHETAPSQDLDIGSYNNEKLLALNEKNWGNLVLK